MLQNDIISKRLLQRNTDISKQMGCFKIMLILYKMMFQVRVDVLKQFWCFKAILTKPGLILFTENKELSECYALCITVTFKAYLKCDVPSAPISLKTPQLSCTQKCQEYHAHLLDICYSLTLKPQVPPGSIFVKAKAVALTLIN